MATGYATNPVFATPAREMQLELRIAISVRHLDATPRLAPPLALAGKLGPVRRGLEALIMRQAFAAYAHDVEQDFVIWKHKEFVARPALAIGDGPVMKYRRLAEQFYEPSALGRTMDERAEPIECR